ncbi:hypothetical protein [Streptomyces sp. A1547]|uniref:hypothetical protein n=1 Tax=Streptomyces sp. A1547 TaxID=2563105 RepID=UPI00144AD45B|nr:hypothetical protein [Streptomyces sp. A1547]
MSGWATDADADELAALAAGEFEAAAGRLTAPGTGPLAVLGQVRVIERFRSGPVACGCRWRGWPAGALPRNGRRAGWSVSLTTKIHPAADGRCRPLLRAVPGLAQEQPGHLSAWCVTR